MYNNVANMSVVMNSLHAAVAQLSAGIVECRKQIDAVKSSILTKTEVESMIDTKIESMISSNHNIESRIAKEPEVELAAAAPAPQDDDSSTAPAAAAPAAPAKKRTVKSAATMSRGGRKNASSTSIDVA